MLIGKYSPADLDMYLKQSQTFNELTLTELELDRLITQEMKNKTGKPLFTNTTAYLTKISQGNFFYKRYAEYIQQGSSTN